MTGRNKTTQPKGLTLVSFSSCWPGRALKSIKLENIHILYKVLVNYHFLHFKLPSLSPATRICSSQKLSPSIRVSGRHLRLIVVQRILKLSLSTQVSPATQICSSQKQYPSNQVKGAISY